MKVTYSCEWCGTSVSKIRSPANMLRAPRYCSQACNGAARRGSGIGRRVTDDYNCASCGIRVRTYRAPSAVPARYCSTECTGRGQIGELNPAYSGGRHVGMNGYVLVLMSDHPNADPRGYVYEHRLVAERSIGRPLAPGEVVHHINQIKTDNRPGNLRVMASQAEHMKLHAELRSGTA